MFAIRSVIATVGFAASILSLQAHASAEETSQFIQLAHQSAHHHAQRQYRHNRARQHRRYRHYRQHHRKRYHARGKKAKKRVISMPSSISATEKTFVFDPKRLAWGAYVNGRLVKKGSASGGASYCADVKRRCRTPIGSFRVGRKGSASCKSSKYPLGRGGAPMPYCMFFRGGYAIHGSPNVPNYNASHGCIRVRPAAAAWLSKEFIKHGTRVIVRPY